MGVTAAVDGQCARGPKRAFQSVCFFAPRNKVHSLIAHHQSGNVEAFFFVAIVASTWSLVMVSAIRDAIIDLLFAFHDCNNASRTVAHFASGSCVIQ